MLDYNPFACFGRRGSLFLISYEIYESEEVKRRYTEEEPVEGVDGADLSEDVVGDCIVGPYCEAVSAVYYDAGYEFQDGYHG